MYKKTILVDSFSTFGFHEIFDATILLAASRLCDNVVYYGTKSSISNLKKNIGHNSIDNVSFIYLHQIQSNSVFLLIIRYVLSAFMSIYILLKNKNNNILILNNNPFLSCIYSLIRQQLTVFCHGEIELLEAKELGKFAKLQSILLKSYFLKKTIKDNMHFVVLGDSILNNLKCILSNSNFKRFSSIDHPYIFNNSPSIEEHVIDNKKINIGIVGITTQSKGLRELSLILDAGLHHINIYHIGKISDSNDKLKKKGLIIVQRDENNNLSRDKYINWISKMDYLLFLYPSTNYKLTASGAIFESFSNLKPIISLSNDYFNYVKNKTGDIGFTFDSTEEMISFMRGFSFNLDRYEKQLQALRNGRMLFSIDSQMEKFKVIFFPESNCLKSN